MTGVTHRGDDMTVTGLRDWVVDGAAGFARAASACTPEAGLGERPQDWHQDVDDAEPAAEPTPGRVHVVGTTR